MATKQPTPPAAPTLASGERVVLDGARFRLSGVVGDEATLTDDAGTMKFVRASDLVYHDAIEAWTLEGRTFAKATSPDVPPGALLTDRDLAEG